MNNSLSAYSTLKVFHHYDKLEALEKGERLAPVYLRIKPTNICNHNCYYCTYASGNSVNRNNVNYSDTIPWKKMQEIIVDMKDMGVKAVTFSGGGEPLMYPNITEAVKLLSRGGIDYSLISNGQLLKGEVAEAFSNAKWVRISFDSPNKQKYCQMRNLKGSDFDEVCDNILYFSKIKASDCEFGINYVIGSQNYEYIYEMARLAKDLGVNNIKFSALTGLKETEGNFERKDKVLNQILKAKNEFEDDHFIIVSNYDKEIEIDYSSKRQFDICYTQQLVTVIGADCKLYLCHQRAYDTSAEIGDITNASFKDVWFSEQTIKKVNMLKPKCDCKNPCVYEDRNILLNKFFNENKNHINFI